jgi:DNA-binding MarR family transcriptional regulator
MDPRTHQNLDADKRATTFQVLLKVARLINERAIARVQSESKRSFFRPAIANLFPHIAFEGTRVSALAAKVGVTKQAVSKLVAELEREGLVELVPDATDARARLVRFTPVGVAAIRDGMRVFREVEDALAEAVGRERLERLGEDLLVLLDALG